MSRQESADVILMAQSLYAFGALLGVVNTYWSIAFIVLVQLGYAIGLTFARKKMRAWLFLLYSL